MAKGKGKISSSDGVAPTQPRSLRSRKRECPSDEVSQTDSDQATLHQQDREENNTTMVGTPLQHSQSTLQDGALITNQQDQAVGPPCLTKQDDFKEERHAEETNVYVTNVIVNAFEGQEETTVTRPNNDSELECFRVHNDNVTNKSGMEEITPQEGIGSPSQTCTDQLLVFLPTSEEGDGSCAPALVEQLDAKDNSQCNLERNHETSQEDTSNTCMADVKEITKEAEAGLPAKKKRRMGMCGLTERERSHFLQTQKPEKGQNRMERVEKQIYNSNTADLAAQEEIISSLLCPSSPLSIPADRITEQRKAEIKLQSNICGGDDRAETEVHIAVTTSDSTGTVCDPGCSEGKSCEAEGGTEAGPEQTSEPKSDQPAQDEVEEHLGNREQQRELAGSTSEITTQTPETQQTRKEGEDRSTEVDCSPAVGLYTNPTQSEESEKKDDSEASSLHVHTGTKTRSEGKEKMMADADVGVEAEGSSSTFNQPGGLNCGSFELCEAAGSPGSERKESCDPDDERGPSTVNTERTKTRDTTDPYGSGSLDYVSDSQLNTIVLIEEVVMEKEADAGSSDCHEDATDLICGLIRELSSLNRKVMATHRELENLRRGSKTPRSSNR
ncbi:uncharacterized protein LOC111666694 isoform X1 [Seriola lalandi dorsalis]|uniref:uncharacterized protein LOC111666694 isoform X1 n=2 Tax=Seriola lalandi dorsalis TaxID=1841481 RepID=UPI000C6FB917|nr:uncharacterized protein LOC111666694 isoform X1 [Seriola lalandi dorsalis]